MKKALISIFALALLIVFAPMQTFTSDNKVHTWSDESQALSESIDIEELRTYSYASTTAHVSVCGDSYVNNYTDGAGHSYQNSSKAQEPILAVDSIDELTSLIREKMINRQEAIEIRVNGLALTDSDVSSSIVYACEHTGDPRGGDYIDAHIIGGYTYNAEVTSDSYGIYTIVTVNVNFISDSVMEAEVDAAVDALLEELNLWNATDYQKIKGVYDWMTENINYDHEWDDEENDDAHYRHTAHAAIIERKVVCQGIASLFYRLMLELDVDCRYIVGMGNSPGSSERHAWNIVALNGKYYNVDATWDLGLTGYYRNFLCTETNFAWHDRDYQYTTESFNSQYPMATLPYVENVTASGTVNSRISWVLDGDTGTLTVAGEGAIPSYRYSKAPWYEYRNSVRRIVVEEGITEVGERAFYWNINCTELCLPESLIAIREYGFNNLQNLKGVTLPSNLRIIEFCAFSECTSLESITLPDSVTTVGTNAFSNCYALKSATLSAGMNYIPNSMFFGDYRLTSVVIPEGVVRIDNTAFADCGFTKFTIPSTVTQIGTSAFSGCDSLSKFIVEDGNTRFKAVDGVLFSADGTHLISYPAGKSDYSYTVPYGTKYIDYGAFREQKYMYYVYFPASLIKIDGYAFSYCKRLQKVTLPSTLTTLGSDIFRDCTSLYSVTFGNQSIILGDYMFSGCTSLRSITLPTNLREIPNGLFDDCTALSGINIPSTVTRIGSTAFCNCDSLTSVTIPGSVKSIGQQAFDFCQNLTTIIFEDGLKTMDWIVVRNAPRLKKVVIPASVTSIGKENFESCPLVTLYVTCYSTGYNYAKNNGIKYSLSHSYSYSTVTYPTCTEQGYTTYTCVCGDSYTSNYVNSLGHTEAIYEAVAPDCTNDGLTQGKYCSVCGVTIVKQTVISALGHNLTRYEGRSPTCLEPGYMPYEACSVCDYTTYEHIPAAEHTYESVITSPTCVEQGYTTHTCLWCGDYYVVDFVDATGHLAGEQVIENNIAPACASRGSYESVVYCITCGEELSRVISLVDALGHAFTSYVSNGDATCIEDGTETARCERCDVTDTRVDVNSSLGHNYKTEVTAPDCINDGYTTYICSECGDHYVVDFVDATGHLAGEQVIENNIAPACASQGSYESVVYCITCGEELSRVISLVDALGHAFTSYVSNGDATCIEDGTETARCERCNVTDTRVDVNSSLGHNYNAEVTAPDCINDGYTTYICSKCGYYYVADLVDATGHTEAVDEATAPTCTETGLTEGKHCSVCYVVIVAQEVVPANGHNYDSVVTNPTCEEQGYTTHTCHCGEVMVDTYVQALGHNLGGWQTEKAPTCEGRGSERRDCERCDYSETRSIAPVGHNWAEEEEYEICTSCGEVVEKDPSELEKDHSECEAGLFETILNAIINFFRMLFGLPELCICGEEY